MKSSVKVAVILPSRGLMFSETADEILQNVKDIPHKFYFAHGRPLPDCFEEPVEKALENPEITHLWLVEDDMVFPPDTLKKMLDMDMAAVTANYPTTDRGDAAVLSVKGRVIYGGTGCLLVKREVFDELKKPYFRTDIVWIPKNMGDFIKFIGKKKDQHTTDYGLHDVNFYMNLYRLEIPVHKLEETLAQRKLISLGKAGSNNGAHKIVVWKKVKKDRYFTLKKNLPVQERSNLDSVVIDGKEFLTSRAHARKLVKLNMAVRAPKRAVVLDDSEI